MLLEGGSRRAVGYLGRARHADAEESMAKQQHLGSMQDCKKSLSAPFTTLKRTILDADQLSCFGAKIFVMFKAVAVRFFAGSPFHTNAFHWNFLFLERQSNSKHSNSALTQRFSVYVFRSPGKRNTCGLARGTNLFRGTATQYDIQFVILRLRAHPELDHCRDTLEGQRNVCAFLSSPAPIGSRSQQKIHFKSVSAKFGELTAASTASNRPTTPFAFVDSGNSLSTGPSTDMKSISAFLIYGPPCCPANRSPSTVPRDVSCTPSTGMPTNSHRRTVGVL